MAKRNLRLVTTDNHVEKTRALKIRIDDLRTFDPLTENQKTFFESYEAGDYFIMLLGSAGTGKSFIAIYKALEEVLDKSTIYSKLILVRSPVQSRDMGHMPGTLEEKMSLYEQPYHQICSTLFDRRDAYQRLTEQGAIEFVSTSFIRGTTFDDSIIVVDECQNMTWEELSTIITRVGYRSKIIFCGDIKQTDLNKKKSDMCGLEKFHCIARMMNSYTGVKFTTDDIVRSSLAKEFLIAEEKHGEMV